MILARSTVRNRSKTQRKRILKVRVLSERYVCKFEASDSVVAEEIIVLEQKPACTLNQDNGKCLEEILVINQTPRSHPRQSIGCKNVKAF